MKVLFKGGAVVNVFTDRLDKADVLVENGKIIGVGAYESSQADETIDVTGKYICPGLINGHFHIESTMMTPCEYSKAAILHGTTAAIADPHEITNVCGTNGIEYMLEASKGLPVRVFIMLPSCVPATPFDEAGAILKAADLKPFYDKDRVLGLAEMMNYPGVLADDPDILEKIDDARSRGKTVDGHAPMLTGAGLDKYIAAGISTDHECSSADEGKERISKGQWVMIREGSAAKNLNELMPLLDEPYNHHAIFATDDKNAADIKNVGEIDCMIRRAVQAGKSIYAAIRVASRQAAEAYGIKYMGAIAPGYVADFIVLSNLEQFEIEDVYTRGTRVVDDGNLVKFDEPVVPEEVKKTVIDSVNMDAVSAEKFAIEPVSAKCHVIKVIPGTLITDNVVMDIDFSENNGIDTARDILKIAVIERHHKTGHIGLGFVSGIGLKSGAIASTVSHDSHNLIVVGASDEDMAFAVNYVRKIGGGMVAVCNGQVIADLPLPVAGLMTGASAEVIAKKVESLRLAVSNLRGEEADQVQAQPLTKSQRTTVKLDSLKSIVLKAVGKRQNTNLGAPAKLSAPFMAMAFVSLPVIPKLKLTTQGLVDVEAFKRISLFADIEEEK